MALAVAALIPIVSSSPPAAAMPIGRLPAGSTLRIAVPEAVGGKTVVGQLTVDRAVGLGFVTAFGCDDGIPTNPDGAISRSDLNVNGAVSPVASNRLIVQADYSGNVCFYTEQPAALIVDVNGVTFDTGVNSFANRRTDMRQTATPRLAAGGVLRVSVPEAAGAKTVVGQLTVDQVATAGFVTAYACASGIPTNRDGSVGRSDLNFDGTVSPVASNRLIVQADERGDVCFYAEQPAALVVDVNGVSDVGISSLPNRRTDTRPAAQPRVAAGGVLRVSVPEAAGHRTVVGQLTVDRASSAGFVTGYGCDDGVPGAAEGSISRSDLNFDARVSPVASNRLIVQADADGDVCFFAEQPVAMIVDVNAVSVAGINSFTNHRTDTRVDELPAGSVTTIGVPVWPAYTPKPALDGVAALTGAPADSTITNRPILAVKIDNYGKARPQWALDQADAVIEENAEGISRFVALFHTRLPDVVGPVRSARTADLDLLAAMNRPVFAYSGGNPGVYAWIGSAAMSGVLVDFGAQSNGCYRRSPDRPGPHNLLLDPSCALARCRSRSPVVVDQPGRRGRERGRRDHRHQLRRGHGRSRGRLDVGCNLGHLPPLTGRRPAPRRIGRPDLGAQRRRAVSGLRALTGRCPIAQRRHPRYRHRSRAPRRLGRCGGVVSRCTRGSVRVHRCRDRPTGSAGHRHDVRGAATRRVTGG